MPSRLQTVALLSVLLGISSAGVVIPRAAGDVCGSKGYDHGNGNYYYSESSKVNTYAACSAKCAADSACKSFGVGEACMLFNVPVTGNFDADDESSETYYEKGCLSASSSSASAVKTTSSSLSSSLTTPSAKATSSSLTSSVASSTTKKTSTSSTSSSSASKKTSSTTVKSSTTTSSSSKSSTASSTSSQAATTSALSSTATSPAANKASAAATTTSQAASTTSQAASTTSSASSTVTIPSGCPAPPTIEVTGLSWFNSTHNLDCPNPNYPAGSQVCFDGTHVCQDAADGVPGGPSVCTCVPYCYTGLPSYAYQPLGYGPQDRITISLSDSIQTSCTAVNPTGFRDFEIGSGHVNCGSAANMLEFYGDSNQDTGSMGTVNYNGYVYANSAECKGTPRYGGSFPLSCARDAGGNATCGLGAGKATLSLISFS